MQKLYLVLTALNLCTKHKVHSFTHSKRNEGIYLKIYILNFKVLTGYQTWLKRYAHKHMARFHKKKSNKKLLSLENNDIPFPEKKLSNSN